MTRPGFVSAIVVLPVSQMKQARQWYALALGFETAYLNSDPEEDPEGNYAILRRDSAEVHLFLDEPPREHPWSTAGTGYLYLIVEGLDAVFQKVEASGVPVTRQIQKQDWGARAFQLTDPSGNLILVAEASSG